VIDKAGLRDGGVVTGRRNDGCSGDDEGQWGAVYYLDERTSSRPMHRTSVVADPRRRRILNKDLIWHS